MASSLRGLLHHLDTVYTNSLDEDAPIAEVPAGAIKLPLHAHQKAALAAMERLERKTNEGYTIENESLFTRYGILGDSVGVGKSLMILGHIARIASLPPLDSRMQLTASSTSSCFSLRRVTVDTSGDAGCLIIVPHTLFRQWVDYIKKQTTLEVLCVKTQAEVTAVEFLAKLRKAPIVLISNTLLRVFGPRVVEARIHWKRIFIDEADTIHIQSHLHELLEMSRFVWLVTASWINMLHLNASMWLPYTSIASEVYSPTSRYHYLAPWFKSRPSSTNPYYLIESMQVRSATFYRYLVSVTHRLRPHLVIRCKDTFVAKSISLPPLHRYTILCKSPITHEIVKTVLSGTIKQMLDAGDTTGALEQLGVKGASTDSLIEAVTANMKKELDRLQKTYDFKESLEYSSPAAKATALASLQEKITRTKASIRDIEDRIQNLKTEACPICYEDTPEPLVTPCCSRAFCPTCLLVSMSKNPECPLCRGKIHPSQCTKLVVAAAPPTDTNAIVDTAGAAAPKLEKKPDALLRLLQENPTGRFLVFSKYDNPFASIESAVETLGIRVKQLKGNKDAVAATLRAFETGDIRCLLLNARYAGSGLNITAATHVVLLHAMSHEEEKQILGRAYRIGREGPLHFVKLVHEGEEAPADAEPPAVNQVPAA